MSKATEEVHEHAEHAHDPFDRRVAATTSVIAAVLAVVSVLGFIAIADELHEQQVASDAWSQYQAKSVRRYTSGFAADLFATLNNPEKVKVYKANGSRYDDDMKEISKAAKEHELESEKIHKRALRFHFGEMFLEMSIVFASLAILTKRTFMWYLGMTVGGVGTILACSTLFVR